MPLPMDEDSWCSRWCSRRRLNGRILLGVCVFLLGYFVFEVGHLVMEHDEDQAHFDTRSELEILARGMDQYTVKHGGILPPMQTVEALERAVRPYLSKDDQQYLNFFKSSYKWRPLDTNPLLSQKERASLAMPDKEIVVYRAKGDGVGRHDVLFLDGHHAVIDREHWLLLERQSGLR